MTAILDNLIEIANPAEAAQEIGRLNARLARERTIPDAVSAAVSEITAGVTQTALARWEAIDPYLTLIVHRAAIKAAESIRSPSDPGARDELRVALESLRQGLSAIAESEPIDDQRSSKEIARWLAETAEVPQNKLADLLGVSLRQFQRWMSAQERAHPEGEDARRVRAVARIVNQLRFSLTPTGAIEWFDWPRDDLEGQTPLQLLDEPERLPELTAIAATTRSTYAT